MAVGVGGKGGTGGNAWITTVDLTGSTITTGAGVGSNGQTGNTITDAFGIVAQSVGGGGGIGGSSTARAIDIAVPVDDLSFGSEVSVAVDGSGGNGETVTVVLDSAVIQTRGDRSIGIVAQSVGCGCGIGGSSDAIGRVLQQSDEDDEQAPTSEDEDDGGTTSVSASINVGVGGSGGSAGGASSVSVALANGSSVTTFGENANAVLAQSIGGCGGLGSVGSAQTKGDTEEQFNLNIGVGGNGGGGGNARSVSFALSEDISLTTYGDGSRGLHLQSIGGGGGASQSVSVDVGSSGLPVSANVLDAIYTSADGYTETGAGAENLTVQGSSENAFIATPAVELGRVFDLGNGQGLRAYGRVGWTFSSSDSYTTTARFDVAPPSVAGFDTSLALPDSVGVISAGAQLIGSDTMELDLRYDVAFGEGTSSNALSLWISKKF